MFFILTKYKFDLISRMISRDQMCVLCDKVRLHERVCSIWGPDNLVLDNSVPDSSVPDNSVPHNSVLGQFDLGPDNSVPGQFGTRTIWSRTIWSRNDYNSKNKNRKNLRFDFSFYSADSGSFM